MRYPAEVSEKPSAAGFIGPCLPEEYGGVDVNFLPYVLVFKEIAVQAMALESRSHTLRRRAAHPRL